MTTACTKHVSTSTLPFVPAISPISCCASAIDANTCRDPFPLPVGSSVLPLNGVEVATVAGKTAGVKRSRQEVEAEARKKGAQGG